MKLTREQLQRMIMNGEDVTNVDTSGITGINVKKFEMELSEYNRKMDEAMDKMLSMPETTPTDMMVRWQARENLIYADALIGPELFGVKND